MGNYGLGKLIGKGSFGKVYLATHKLTNGSKVRSLPLPRPQQSTDDGSRWSSSRPTRTIRT